MAYRKFDPTKVPREAEASVSNPLKSTDISGISNISKAERVADQQDGLHDALMALRPNLVPALAGLSDKELFFLVSLSIQNAVSRRVVRPGRRYCPDCGLQLSVLAVSERCGFCGSPQRHAPGS